MASAVILTRRSWSADSDDAGHVPPRLERGKEPTHHLDGVAQVPGTGSPPTLPDVRGMERGDGAGILVRPTFHQVRIEADGGVRRQANDRLHLLGQRFGFDCGRSGRSQDAESDAGFDVRTCGMPPDLGHERATTGAPRHFGHEIESALDVPDNRFVDKSRVRADHAPGDGAPLLNQGVDGGARVRREGLGSDLGLSHG